MDRTRVGIFGGSGYAGRELALLLLRHPRVELAFVASDRSAGTPVAQDLGVSTLETSLKYVTVAQGEALAAECAAVLLATPTEASLELAPKLLAHGCKVIDLSGGFRLSDAEAFTQYYGAVAPPAQLQASAAYGLPELFRSSIPSAKLVANPGCYPTSAALALAPLLSAKLIDPSSMIIDAASGVTGAGRKATEEYSFTELESDFKAYKVLKHQHTPEIAQSLARVAGLPSVKLTFTPHLLPVGRGILSTCYARLAKPATQSDLQACFAQAYGNEPFITLAKSPEQVSLRKVVGTNQCQIGVACEPEVGGQVVVISAIDNLVKGAAGQAVQNLNLVLGWEETTGLTSFRRFAS